ncbi:MAG: LamG domain-containing protein, partial [Candidatus Omnitrophica bacterium]|nr:LamG domain-containing protein [Candidatus Omnitrophota bacterium]
MRRKIILKGNITAFTLIELLVVLIIIVVIGSAIIGRMLSGIDRAKLQAAGRQVVSHIRLAQERAKLEQRNITVELSAENETYKVYQAGLNFDGTDDIVVSDNANLRPSVFAVEAWVRSTANGAWQGAVSKERNLGTGGCPGYNLNKDQSTNKLRMMIGNNTTYTYVVSDSAYTDTNWHHVVGIYDGIKGYLYIDGVKQVNEQTITVEHTTDNLYIGRYYTNSTSIRWQGDINEVRIY